MGILTLAHMFCVFFLIATSIHFVASSSAMSGGQEKTGQEGLEDSAQRHCMSNEIKSQYGSRGLIFLETFVCFLWQM